MIANLEMSLPNIASILSPETENLLKKAGLKTTSLKSIPHESDQVQRISALNNFAEKLEKNRVNSQDNLEKAIDGDAVLKEMNRAYENAVALMEAVKEAKLDQYETEVLVHDVTVLRAKQAVETESEINYVVPVLENIGRQITASSESEQTIKPQQMSTEAIQGVAMSYTYDELKRQDDMSDQQLAQHHNAIHKKAQEADQRFLIDQSYDNQTEGQRNTNCIDDKPNAPQNKSLYQLKQEGTDLYVTDGSRQFKLVHGQDAQTTIEDNAKEAIQQKSQKLIASGDEATQKHLNKFSLSVKTITSPVRILKKKNHRYAFEPVYG